MKKFFSKLKKNKKGYTLTELIVVVAILGVLAAIAVPSVMSALDSSKKQADITSAKAIETAVQVCLADGTLTLQKVTVNNNTQIDVIRDKDGNFNKDNIRNAIKVKIKGGEFPKHATNKTDLWKLVLPSGQVEQVDKNASDGSENTYLLLDKVESQN